jgi:hypothetical protein
MMTVFELSNIARRGLFIYLAPLLVAQNLCGLVVRVPGYRSISPGSIRGGTRFSEK